MYQPCKLHDVPRVGALKAATVTVQGDVPRGSRNCCCNPCTGKAAGVTQSTPALHQLPRYLSWQAAIVSEHWGERSLPVPGDRDSLSELGKMREDGEENKLKTGSANALWQVPGLVHRKESSYSCARDKGTAT